jgi:ribonuclease P protein component
MAARERSGAAPSLSFPRARRLCKPGDFKRVYAGGRRIGNEFFTINAEANALERARLGMSVAVRTMGGAVARNRVRRLIRESFRHHQALMPPLDIIVGVRAAARAAASTELRASLERLWQKLMIR